MNEAELEHIELDLELPGYYRELMLNYPSQLSEICKGSGGCCELSNSPKHIIDLNREVRRMQGFDWPEEYFVIGESGCGDYYAIDLDDDYSSVYLWNHEQGDFADEEEIDSLEEFAGKNVRELPKN